MSEQGYKWLRDSGKPFDPPYAPVGKNRFRTLAEVRCPVWLTLRGVTHRPLRACFSPYSGIRIDDLGWLTVPTGTEWDGASGPTFDTPGIRAAALVHDALYRLFFDFTLDVQHRKAADQVFRQYLRINGVNPFRRWYYYAAVRLFSGRVVRSEQKKWRAEYAD